MAYDNADMMNAQRSRLPSGRAFAGWRVLALWLLTAGLLGGCFGGRPPAPPLPGPDQIRARIDAALPAALPDRSGWVEDLYAVFGALAIAPTPEHICAVVAVGEQESDLRVDPQVPGLGQIAWREIDQRAAHAGIPNAVVHEVLKLKSSDGRSYAERIDQAHTEKQLSDIFEDFTGAIPLGHTLFASWNPIHTRGPMQVSVAFAHQFAAQKPYPFALQGSLDAALFTRRGSLYFGTAHLLDYSAPYDRYLYRFADYNAGQYSSRNAAFQRAVGIAAHVSVVADGALLVADAPAEEPSDTERAVRLLAGRLKLDATQIHAALAEGRSQSFEASELYRRVFELAEHTAGHPLPRAALPQIDLQGPKLHSHLTTQWYAQRVQGRYARCLGVS